MTDIVDFVPALAAIAIAAAAWVFAKRSHRRAVAARDAREAARAAVAAE